MIDASDGSAFTGSVTVYVTGNGGTQAAGSVGSGACTDENNGFYTYAPAQAETNYDHVAFTFIGTGAIPVTVQVYPHVAYATDAALATVDTEVGDIKTKTDYLPSATAGASGGLFIAGSNAGTTVDFTGNLSGSVNSVTTGVTLADDAITASKYDESTAFPVKSADTGSTQIARKGADSDTLETLSDALDAVYGAFGTIFLTAQDEPSGVPAANEHVLDKIGYLYMAMRNKLDVTATEKSFYDDAGNVEWKKALSDDSTTYSEGEAAAP